jgi:DNA-binding transcriptional LysR family regulator
MAYLSASTLFYFAAIATCVCGLGRFEIFVEVRMHTLDRAIVFLRVGELGDFNATARSLNVPKEFICRAVAELEVELQTTLLERTSPSLALTEAGVRLSDRYRLILGDLQDVDFEAVSAATHLPNV